MSGLVICGCAGSGQEPEVIPEVSVETVPDGEVAGLCRMFNLPLTDYGQEHEVIRKNENLASILQSRGVDYQQVYSLTQKARGVFDLRKLKAGNPYTLLYAPGAPEPSYFIYEENYRTHVCFSLTDSLWVARAEIPIEIQEKFVDITISSSLWQDLEEAGYNPLVANGLSEVFAWTVDFFGLQKGDTFRASYQAYMLKGKEVEAGPILAASFIRAGRTQNAFRYLQDSVPGYWDQDGVNLQRAFLKAPLKFSRISSGFSYARRHPITRIVMSIGEGKVIERTYTRAGGNTVRIKHNSVYTTAYLHLSRFASGLTVGKHVAQGETIGYVGSTGSSTGPHLDFRVWRNGKPINPLTMESPPADPIHASDIKSFKEHIAPYRRGLEPECYKRIALQIISLAGVRFN